MKANYVHGKWHCEKGCKNLIALNIVCCRDGTFKCLYCRSRAFYVPKAYITPDQMRKRFGIP